MENINICLIFDKNHKPQQMTRAIQQTQYAVMYNSFGLSYLIGIVIKSDLDLFNPILSFKFSQ